VTLAEIYAAQGHVERALRMLDEVIEKEPEHEAARALRERLTSGDEPARSARAPKPRRMAFESLLKPGAPFGSTALVDPEAPSNSDAAGGDEISDVIVCKVETGPESQPESGPAESDPEPESEPETQADPFEVTQEWTVAGAAFSSSEPATGQQPSAGLASGSDEDFQPEDGFGDAVREETQTWPDGASGPELALKEAVAAEVDVYTAPDSGYELYGAPTEVSPPVLSAPAVEIVAVPSADSESAATPPSAESVPAEAEPAAAAPLPTDVREQRSSPVASPVVDAVLVLRHEQRLYVYWQIVDETCARARHKQPGGRLCLKLISLKPRWDGAERHEHEIDLDALQGYLAIDLDTGDAVVRAAIGWRDAGRFRPLAIAAELAGWSGKNQLELREHPFDRPRTDEELATLQHLGRRALERVRGVQ
ncbi:MAG TPA: DUF4912 domain-containing protein, partial [Polyangiaceae bacterium]|nr:DUF4912 domain-containing protein [Polyangiaceae bacterium]